MRKLLFLVLPVALLAAYLAAPDARATATSDNSAVSVGAGIRYICQTSAPAPVGRARDWVLCSSGHRIFTDVANVDHDISGASGAYSTIADEGSNLTQRSTVNFIGANVACTDNAGATRTDCTVSGPPEIVIDMAALVASGTSTNEAGDISLGTDFVLTAASTVTGVKFYWAGPATTVKVSLWLQGSGTRVASGTGSVTGAGLKTISFSSPYSASAYTRYVASVHDNAGLNFTDSSFVTWLPAADPFINGPHFVQINRSEYHAGDLMPDTAAGLSIVYPITPILTVP